MFTFQFLLIFRKISCIYLKKNFNCFFVNNFDLRFVCFFFFNFFFNFFLRFYNVIFFLINETLKFEISNFQSNDKMYFKIILKNVKFVVACFAQLYTKIAKINNDVQLFCL